MTTNRLQKIKALADFKGVPYGEVKQLARILFGIVSINPAAYDTYTVTTKSELREFIDEQFPNQNVPNTIEFRKKYVATDGKEATVTIANKVYYIHTQTKGSNREPKKYGNSYME